VPGLLPYPIHPLFLFFSFCNLRRPLKIQTSSMIPPLTSLDSPKLSHKLVDSVFIKMCELSLSALNLLFLFSLPSCWSVLQLPSSFYSPLDERHSFVFLKGMFLLVNNLHFKHQLVISTCLDPPPSPDSPSLSNAPNF